MDRQERRRRAVAAITATRVALPVSALVRPRRETVVDDAVTWVTTGRVDPARPVAVVAHWDPLGTVPPVDVLLLESLSDSGFQVLLVSTASGDPASLAAAAGDRCVAVAARRNVGFDFMSWRRGIEHLGPAVTSLPRLLLLNNSMYGPVRPLAPFLDRAFGPGGPDVVGFTGSREFLPHAQSYALGFGPAALRSRRFADYWPRVRAADGKWGTILGHELRWMRDLTGGPVRGGVVVPAPPQPVNPLTLHWRDLLAAGFPFVKRSLFLANYDDVDLTGWRSVIGPGGPLTPDDIEADLRRRGAAAPPA